jgi:hypothetical protein
MTRLSFIHIYGCYIILLLEFLILFIQINILLIVDNRFILLHSGRSIAHVFKCFILSC